MGRRLRLPLLLLLLPLLHRLLRRLLWLRLPLPLRQLRSSRGLPRRLRCTTLLTPMEGCKASSLEFLDACLVDVCLVLCVCRSVCALMCFFRPTVRCALAVCIDVRVRMLLPPPTPLMWVSCRQHYIVSTFFESAKRFLPVASVCLQLRTPFFFPPGRFALPLPPISFFRPLPLVILPPPTYLLNKFALRRPCFTTSSSLAYHFFPLRPPPLPPFSFLPPFNLVS